MGSHALLNVQVPIRGMTAADLSDRLGYNDQDKYLLVEFVTRMLQTAMFRDGGGIRVQAQGITTNAAYGTFTVTRADVTTGDIIYVLTPDGNAYPLTAVASGPTAANGEWTRGATDTTAANSIAAAINAYPPVSRWMSADNSSGTVRITAREDSTISNNIKLREAVTTSTATSLTSSFVALGSLSSGVTATSLMPAATAVTITIGAAPTANDTLRFGNVVLTWKASAANENEVTLNANTTTSATNLKNKINAHSVLSKLMTATSSAEIVTLTWSNFDFLASQLYLLATGTTPGTISGQFVSAGVSLTLSGSAVAAGIP